MGWRGFRAALGSALLVIFAWMWLAWPHKATKRAAVVRAWRALLWGFRIDVVVKGKAAALPGTLYVANHVSWTDIVVIGRVLDAPFVAKGDVRGWPIIGTLTTAYGCVYIDRERRAGAGRQAEDVGAHLARSGELVLFAEGTTGLGNEVLPFRTSLFALVPQNEAGEARVQPITLRYTARDGSPLSPADRREVAWIGDDEMLPHMKALARRGGLRVEVWFEEPVTGSAAGRGRKDLAAASRARIAERLASFPENAG